MLQQEELMYKVSLTSSITNCDDVEVYTHRSGRTAEQVIRVYACQLFIPGIGKDKAD